MDDLLTVEEVAQRLRVHKRTVRRLCKEGAFRDAVQVGSLWRIPAPSITPAAMAKRAAKAKTESI